MTNDDLDIVKKTEDKALALVSEIHTGRSKYLFCIRRKVGHRNSFDVDVYCDMNIDGVNYISAELNDDEILNLKSFRLKSKVLPIGYKVVFAFDIDGQCCEHYEELVL